MIAKNGQQASGFLVDIEGMDKVINMIRTLPDRTKRLEILKILRRQVEPIKEAVKKNTPVYDYTVKRRVKGASTVYEYKPGNLKESISIFSGKSRNFPTVYVGPAMGVKKKYDGYYGFFVIYGTKNGIEGNDFVRKGASNVLPSVTNEATQKLKKYIEGKIKRQGL